MRSTEDIGLSGLSVLGQLHRNVTDYLRWLKGEFLMFDVRSKAHAGSLAFFSVGLAYLAHLALGNDGMAPFQLFVFAVLASAWWGGFPSGVLATLLTVGVVRYGLDYSDPIRLLLAAFEGFGVTFAISALHHARITAFEQHEIAVHTESKLLSQERHAREEAELMTSALRHANIAKDEFLAIISHELKTPMTSSLGWAQIISKHMQSEHLDEEFLRTGLENIEACLRTQAQLIDDMLDLSRIRLGKLYVNQRHHDLNEIVSGVVHRVASPAAFAKGLKVTVITDPSVGFVYIDPNRIQQVIWNLLSNAVKFTDEGEIRVEVKRVDHQVFITVTDTGCGIDPQKLPLVFQKFRTSTKTSREYTGGLGLGLTIAQELVRLHGGNITAHSEGTGKGSRFVVSLPV